jgi:hypothetical protein
MRTYGVVALLSVIWLIVIAMGHRRYVALTFAGIIVLICVVRAWLDVRRGPPWIRG